LDLSSGEDWLQVYRCTDGQSTCDSSEMSWVTIPSDSVYYDSATGRYYILVDTVATGTVRPTLQIRFVDGTSDTSGNSSDTSSTTWTAVVTGDPRPDVVDVSASGTVTVIPSSEASVVSPGSISIKASNGSSGSSWWSSEGGYTSTSSSCEDTSYCAGPTIVVNRPVRMIIYIYDLVGTAAYWTTIDITESDLENLNTDKLDRVTLTLDWNYRTAEGRLVGSGIYIWRIVSYAEVEGRSAPSITNQLYKTGLKVK
jgi:hypothetical protein